MNDEQIIASGRRVLRLETEALAGVEQRLGEGFARAVALIVRAKGRVIVTGVGKSGLIARKIAATLTSTGTPATFLHPVESLHGDLGMVGGNDVAILISKSGESEELLNLLVHLKRFGVTTVALTGNTSATRPATATRSSMASCARRPAPRPGADHEHHGGIGVRRRPGRRHPRAERAFAVRISRGFIPAARWGDGCCSVRDIMETDRLPLLGEAATIREAVVPLARRRGIVIITDRDAQIRGVFTAGDLTRLMEKDDTPFDVKLTDVMTRTPKVAHAEELASAVVYRMEQIGIIVMPVTDSEGRVVGVVHLHDLMRAGVA
jgi:arabinose-5-phosphate isomerase